MHPLHAKLLARIGQAIYERNGGVDPLKKILISTFVALIAIVTLTAAVYAAPNSSGAAEIGPYEGIFYGFVSGDKGSRAPIALRLTHRGDVVKGYVYLGDGLHVDAGICGSVNVPAGSQAAAGRTLPKDASRLLTQSTFKVDRFKVSVEFDSQISDDGKEITADTTIDLPWICGRDPVISGTLTRINTRN